MIDTTTETLVSLREAPTYLPQIRKSGDIHPSTLARWANDGIDGVHLETVRVGRTVCTSLEALRRFIERTSGAARAQPEAAPPDSGGSD